MKQCIIRNNVKLDTIILFKVLSEFRTLNGFSIVHYFDDCSLF